MIKSRLQFILFLVLVVALVALSSSCDYPQKVYVYGDSITHGCVPCMAEPPAPDCTPCPEETEGFRLDCDNYSYSNVLQAAFNALDPSNPFFCACNTLNCCIVENGEDGRQALLTQGNLIDVLNTLTPEAYPNLHTIIYWLGGNDVLGTFSWAVFFGRIGPPWTMEPDEHDLDYIRTQIVESQPPNINWPSAPEWSIKKAGEEILSRGFDLVLGTYGLAVPGTNYHDDDPVLEAAHLAMVNKFVKVFNEEMRVLQGILQYEFPGRVVKLADFNDKRLGDDGSPTYDPYVYYRIDGIHPNAEGNVVVSSVLYDLILGY